jgi:hypothetical protein
MRVCSPMDSLLSEPFFCGVIRALLALLLRPSSRVDLTEKWLARGGIAGAGSTGAVHCTPEAQAGPAPGPARTSQLLPSSFSTKPGYRLDGETFACQRQLAPPAIWAEPGIRLGAREVEQLDGHSGPRQVVTDAAV